MAPTEPTGYSTPWRQRLRQLTCGLLLIASAFLLWRTVSDARRHFPVNAPVILTAFSDPKEKPQRLHDVVGTFATGNAPGDRLLVIGDNGRIRFKPVGAFGEALAIEDQYEIGRRGKDLALSTAKSGPVDILDIDHLRFGDVVYERVSTERPR